MPAGAWAGTGLEGLRRRACAFAPPPCKRGRAGTSALTPTLHGRTYLFVAVLRAWCAHAALGLTFPAGCVPYWGGVCFGSMTTPTLRCTPRRRGVREPWRAAGPTGEGQLWQLGSSARCAMDLRPPRAPRSCSAGAERPRRPGHGHAYEHCGSAVRERNADSQIQSSRNSGILRYPIAWGVQGYLEPLALTDDVAERSI